ncbi:hypothetical protein [Streptomyces goshikiensis]|uniref:hypothetical protein n=1 Tax=Streptomyces goshikiensis TaxID=1942 RepID=UPI0037AACEB6
MNAADYLISILDTHGIAAIESYDSGGTFVAIHTDHGVITISGTSPAGDATVTYPATDDQHLGWGADLRATDTGEYQMIYDSQGDGRSLFGDTAELAHLIARYLADPAKLPTVAPAAPEGQSYRVPDNEALRDALALADSCLVGREAAARTMCVLLAATIRDLFTDYEPEAPFDAVALELLLHISGRVSPSGWYWTADGTRRELPGAEDTYHLSEWSGELGKANRAGWLPLCTLIGGTMQFTRYRLDLARAAALPLT